MKSAGSPGEMLILPRSVPIRRGRTCVDLFSGAGGLAVGFRLAGWQVLAANDHDPHAGATFRLNFPETAFFQGSIALLNAKRLLEECEIKRGELDCLIGGPPCQSFSYNNHQRNAHDERAKLFEHYIRLVSDLLPKTIVMENVPGILTIDNSAVTGEISSKLATLGYKTEISVLSAEQFGTPQIRRRVFIVASRLNGARKLLPEPTHQRAIRAIEAESCLLKPITVAQAISDLPGIENGGGVRRGAYTRNPTTEFQKLARVNASSLTNHVCHKLSEKLIERISFVPEGGNWRHIPERLLPAGMRRARKSDHTKRYGRLLRKGLASTLLTKCDPHWGAYIHPTQNRTISVREAARLQGFPDNFEFAGDSISKHYVQVGNAVPVPVAKAIASSVHEHLSASDKPIRARNGGTRIK